MFEKLEKNFSKASIDINTLRSDVQKMIAASETGEKASRSSLEPITRLRKDEKEIEKAKEDPDMQFIEDKIGDILKGIFD